MPRPGAACFGCADLREILGKSTEAAKAGHLSGEAGGRGLSQISNLVGMGSQGITRVE